MRGHGLQNCQLPARGILTLYIASSIHRLFQKPLVRILLAFGLTVALGLYWLTEKPSRDLAHIHKTGEVTLITRNNAHCYYLYRGQAMGFEYDLASAFAKELGVKLRVKIVHEWEDMIPVLKKSVGHFLGASLTITPKRQTQVSFSNGYMTIRQHIIVHRDNHAVRHLKDLAGITVHVRKGTSYQDLLQRLQQQGVALKIKLWENTPTSELIRKVAVKDIEVTIADSNVAQLNRRYYPQIVIADPISGKEHLAWAVHPEAHKLLKQINAFLKRIQSDGTFGEIYKRYYTDVESFDFVDLRAYHRRLETRLPKYGKTIKTVAERYGFDWRLIAAQMYQESHFRQWAKSHAGAYGLMQLTRHTAKSLGVTDIHNPSQNIEAGVRHLKNLYGLFDEAVGADRIFIALGAYNVGQGHIRDAQRLAKKMGLSVSRWADLSTTLPLLEQRKYYKNARYGYCRGSEAVAYVRQIMIYYDILKHKSIEFNTPEPEPLPDTARKIAWRQAL